MGLLDDAIREHLELKRRHGAGEDEVRRLEAEALGPVRREPVAERPATAPAEAPPAQEEPAREPQPEPEPTVAEHALPRLEQEQAPEPVGEPTMPSELPPAEALADPAPRGFTDDEPWLDEPDEVPAGEALHHPRRAGQPTTEFTPHDVAEAEDEFVAPDEEPAEDVLEETPDFLQETPEHERLWFEQRPPRDFDFNG